MIAIADITTSEGSANECESSNTAGALCDYFNNDRHVIFKEYECSYTFEIAINDIDREIEDMEDFTVNIKNVVGAHAGQPIQAKVFIKDDDSKLLVLKWSMNGTLLVTYKYRARIYPM